MRSVHTSLVRAFGVFVVSALVAGPVAAQADSQIGVWKLNLAKSTFNPSLVPRPEGWIDDRRSSR